MNKNAWTESIYLCKLQKTTPSSETYFQNDPRQIIQLQIPLQFMWDNKATEVKICQGMYFNMNLLFSVVTKHFRKLQITVLGPDLFSAVCIMVHNEVYWQPC